MGKACAVSKGTNLESLCMEMYLSHMEPACICNWFPDADWQADAHKHVWLYCVISNLKQIQFSISILCTQNKVHALCSPLVSPAVQQAGSTHHSMSTIGSKSIAYSTACTGIWAHQDGVKDIDSQRGQKSYSDAMEETETIIFEVVGNLLAQSRIHPQEVGLLAAVCAHHLCVVLYYPTDKCNLLSAPACAYARHC